MWFRNERDGGDLLCTCRNWQRHWMLFNPGGPSASLFWRECAVLGCHGPFEVGGRVRRIGVRSPGDGHLCITPMCLACHGSPGLTFRLKPGVRPAPADPGQTCDRPR